MEMAGTLKKLKNLISNTLPLITVYKRDRNSLKTIKYLVRFLFFCLFLYIFMTFWEWHMTDHFDLKTFQDFITKVGALSGALTVLSSYLVDEDRDGRSDKAQREAERSGPGLLPKPPDRNGGK